MAKEVEPEEVIRLIDSVYKSIIDKFNPCARQLITAGKAYLKALQGANSASNVFIETLNKIAVNAQQGTSSDIGDALLNVVNVHKAIQEQHVNILKAFYVDLLMPLETNLEKDTKVVQVEQKKFLQQHKANVESYCKAVTTLKKQRKKKSASGTTSKELKSLQAVEEQKNKLRVYCNQSLKNALTQERRRYGFVLERQCSIAKHWMSYYNTGKTLLDNNLDDWLQIAATRENVNLNLHDLFSKNKDGNKSDLESNSLLLRKTRSMEVAGGPDNKRDDRGFNQNSLPRTKSEHNLTMSTSAHQNHRFSNVTSEELVEELLIMKAVYTYQANGKNQLNFEEGDRIALIGGRVNGWQFGENLRTKMMGWFPVTYLEKDNSHHYQQQKQHQHNQYNNQQHHSNLNNSNSNNNMDNDNHHQYRHDQTPISTLKRGINSKSTPEITAEPSPTRMFGDTIQFRNTRYFQKISAADLRTSPPPALPPPIPTESVSSAVTGNHLNTSQSFNFPKESLNAVEKRRPIIYKANKYAGHNNSDIEPPPPQPEIDYSDEEEIVPTRVPLRQHHRNNDNNRDDNMKRPLSSMTYDERVSSSSTRNSSASPKSHHQHHHLMSNNLADIDLNTLTRKDNFIKRTKSFWKNKKQDEIHHQINNGGMSWRHEDIIMNQKNNNNNIEYKNQEQFLKSDNNSDSSYQMDGTMDRRTRSTHNQQNNENSNNSPKPQQKYLKSQPKLSSSKLNHHHQQQDKSKLQEMNISVNNNNNNRNKHTNKTKIESKTITSMNFDNKSNNNFHQKSSHRHHHNNFDSDDSDNSTIKISEINNNQNFDDISTISLIKKPFKRREILKQYYNNTNTDEEDEEDLDFDDRNVDHHHHRHHLHHHHNHQSINNKNIHNHDDNHHPNDDHNHNHDHGDDDDDDDDNERDDYSDGSDTERENDTTISDPYDCIVIDDHLVKSKMEFKTFKGETNNNNQQTQVQSSPKHQIQNKIKNDQNEHNNNINNNKNININNKNKNSALNSASNTTATTTTSGTLLPRTKLNKSTNNSKENHLNNNNNIRTSTSNPIQSSSSLLLTDNNNKMMSNNNNNEDNNNSYINSSSNNNNNKNHQQDYSDDSYSKSYGPWYDLWEDNNNNNKQSLHNITKS